MSQFDAAWRQHLLLVNASDSSYSGKLLNSLPDALQTQFVGLLEMSFDIFGFVLAEPPP
jgi:hypothetical protein